MGRTMYWMNVSLDLRIEREVDEHGAGQWMRIDEQLHREFNARARELTLAIEGRVVHETMEAFWPAARHDESLPEFLREYGHIWTDADKVLVSNTRAEAPHASRIVGGDDAIAQLAALRDEVDGTIGVGGANLATQLLRHGLLDELLLFVHPVVLGRGRPLFDDPQPSLELELLEHRTFDSGVAMHRYAIGGAVTSGA